MQNLREIRQLLLSEGFRPNKGLGQSFLIDGNLMRKLVRLADLTGAEIVLEVGSATGSLTEELLLRAKKVVAVEVDKVLAGILHRRLAGRENLIIINRSILARKQKIAPEVIQALSNQFDDLNEVHLVANLPFCVAVPVIMNCLILSWRAIHAESESDKKEAILFTRLTFTVQQELAERLTASPGQRAYGSISVIAALLSRIKASTIIPPQAFWPRPEVFSRMTRMDFNEESARKIDNMDVLKKLLSSTFRHRRKKIATIARYKDFPFPAERFLTALRSVGVDPSARPDKVAPEAYLVLANELAGQAHFGDQTPLNRVE